MSCRPILVREVAAEIGIAGTYRSDCRIRVGEY